MRSGAQPDKDARKHYAQVLVYSVHTIQLFVHPAAPAADFVLVLYIQITAWTLSNTRQSPAICLPASNRNRLHAAQYEHAFVYSVQAWALVALPQSTM